MSGNEHVQVIGDDPTIPLNVMIRNYRDEIRRLVEPESDIWWCAEYLADWGDELANRLAEATARADAAEKRLDRHRRLEMILGADIPPETLKMMIDIADDLDAAPGDT